MRVVVVGAGLAGLTAARALRARHDVVVLEKSEVVGGRLVTTTIGDATFDEGAQFFTVRGEALAAQTAEWLAAGLVHEWSRGFGPEPDGHPRYVGSRGMAPLAADLASALDVRLGRFVFTLHRRHGGWHVVIDDGSVVEADAVVLTCPVPQSRALLMQSDVELPTQLTAIAYRPTFELLVVLDGPSGVPAPGGVQLDASHVVTFVADNAAKGISTVPCLTCHAGGTWAEQHAGDALGDVEPVLLEHAAQWFGPSAAVARRVRRWRLATPQRVWDTPCWFDAERRVVLAGDAFDGPKFEGAFRSGLAAADAVEQLSRASAGRTPPVGGR